MAQEHRLQSQRFELKYLISRRMIPGIRGFLSSHLELDDYCSAWQDRAYPIHSIYLDSPDLRTYADSVNGVKNRFKLRLRYYDDAPASPVFFEVKGRVDSCITKQRCGVSRDAVSLVLDGQMPRPEQIISRNDRHIAALEHFQRLMLQLRAVPKAHNCYYREAWVSRNDNSVRVTFDKAITIEPCFERELTTRMIAPKNVFDEMVVLELKFTTRFPSYLRELVEVFQLMQGSASKYADGISVSGEQRYYNRGLQPFHLG